MRYWWVNQNQTLQYEITGGYMWSPKTKIDGGRNKFYDYMTEVDTGDVVFSFSDTRISFIGIATGRAYSSNKPHEFNDIESWSDNGWLAPVEFYELQNSIRPKNHIKAIKPYLPNKYSPLQSNGNGNQCVYLTEVPLELANELSKLLGNQVEQIVERHKDEELAFVEDSNVDSKAIDEIRQRKDIHETEKLRFIKSRNGQGIFKDRVKEIEQGCRVTGLSDVKYLIASHIKPWAKSNDFERLDGNNGLLLSPHIDKLFDSGYISFEDNGDMITSPKLNLNTLDLWMIDKNNNVGSFNNKQQYYLQYHRDNVLKR